MPAPILLFTLAIALQQATPLPSSPAPDAEAVTRQPIAIFKARGGQMPVLVYQVDPEFTKESRRKHVSGDVLIALVVDAGGIPQQVHVVKVSV